MSLDLLFFKIEINILHRKSTFAFRQRPFPAVLCRHSVAKFGKQGCHLFFPLSPNQIKAINSG